MQNFPAPSLSLICGAPGSGKSHLIKYMCGLLHRQNKFDYVLVLSGTPFNEFYQQFINPHFIHMYSDVVLNNMMQLAIRGKPDGYKWLLIMDDCIGSANFNMGLFKKLITCYRHYNISILLVSQYCNSVPPVIRTCAMMAFVFGQTTKRGIDAVYESFGASNYDKIDAFKRAWLNRINRYECLVVNNTETDVGKRYKIFKAPASMPEFFLDNGKGQASQ